VDKLITDYQVNKVESGCAPVSGRYGLQINVVNDISLVFPYLNALLDETWYDHQNSILIWKEKDRAYALRPHEIIVVTEQGIDEPVQIRRLVSEIVDRVNNTWNERATITPRFTEKARPTAIDIYKLLPKTNCKQCGYTTCLVFAADLRDGKTRLECCPTLTKPENSGVKQKLENILSPSL
jgi:ArsR family metal-binding transcriptional regulator